ncbi:ATP-dependent endonuclease [Paenibacillus marchantiae]|uniref:ATP-dependent nuclease n=1 Tax=Paenibacillus marchantiae TaxID=3026433 RepID=UPI00237ACC3A|nr:ATP-dependent endonuclease [Paenibacillus marchantiae]WDQ32414.1 ATP-dependent endonuclease [Paenibacillus marchantiae]
MQISKVKIENFRLLKSLELDLEKELSLVIGKNNCGKTSLLSILDKFIGSKANVNTFSLDDFNIDFLRDLINRIEAEEDEEKESSTYLGISLMLFIKYDEGDDLSNISKLMLDLDPNHRTIVLKFEYRLIEEDLRKMRNDYKEFQDKQLIKKNVEIEDGKVENRGNIFLRDNHKKYFKLSKKSLGYDTETSTEIESEYIDLLKEKIAIEKVISFKMISAKRNVSNIDSDKTLSILSSNYYKKKEEKNQESEKIQEFKDILSRTDKHLNEVYNNLFEKIIEKVGMFGGIRKGDSNIKIVSTLQHKELLKDNTTVMYDHNGEHSLPENYNGLGYLNLISMIFEIELILSEFRFENKLNEEPANINLLFIEEPEAHTHPQMQYIFIKNIKDILNSASKGDDGKKFNLQTIITTHSCHITAESDFNDIKYFYKTNQNQVIAKNLKDLEKEYEKDKEISNFKFLKQYLTLHRAELFFADKAIFIEGDTERLLLPAMMKKIDQETDENPLLSQNISIVEVGAYSHIFEKFIAFIGIKSLIITDIDSAMKKVKKNEDGKEKIKIIKCRVSDEGAFTTTNASLKYFVNYSNYIVSQSFGKEVASTSEILISEPSEEVDILNFYSNLNYSERILLKDPETKKWLPSDGGNLLIIYQTSELNSLNIAYHARSFEDSFFHINRQFIIDNKESFKSLVNIKYFEDKEKDSYFLAEECVDKKPSFAMEILLNSKEINNKKHCNWDIPSYIKEGLLWLKNN